MTTQTVNQTAKTSQANKPGVLSLAIKEKSMLYSAYMPFVKKMVAYLFQQIEPTAWVRRSLCC